MGRRRIDPETGQPELLPREAALVAGVVQGKSQSAAAREAGYAPATASKRGSDVLSRPEVRERFRSLMREAGLDDESLVGELRRLMHVERKGITPAGDVVSLGDDGNTQIKALDMAMRISDAYPNPKLDIDMTVRGAILIASADDYLVSPDSPRVLNPDPAD